jgi:cation diffusion facilitator family transporter
LAIGSLIIGGLVLLLKLAAWWITGSVAILSDALESLVNIAAALAALVAIIVAEQPPDEEHPFGHHKAEFISAVLEGVLIVLAALFIIREAVGRLMAPESITAPLPGLALLGAATVLNAFWARKLVAEGGALGSPALIADGRHLWADVMTTLGVALGVGLATVTGWWQLDPIVAALVAAHILWAGWRVMRSALSGLMDEAVPQETLDRIRNTIAETSTGAVQVHDLKTRHAGRAVFIEFHLVVSGSMSVAEAHEICDTLEASLGNAIPDSQTVIHLEPAHKAETSGDIIRPIS